MGNITDRVLAGDVRALSRLITQIENDDPESIGVLKGLYNRTGRAKVVGITGPPGVGKSTLINGLTGTYLKSGLRVAVIAIDPSSDFSGGGILGDRVRMQHAGKDLYIRSFGSRGHLGGLNRACGNVIHLLDAVGYEVIIVETAGTGQSEIDIWGYAHTTVVVTSPNQGDDIQALKAGILEIGDIFVVNKADLADSDRAIAVLVEMTNRFRQGTGEGGYIPPVVKTIAKDGVGINDLKEAIGNHYFHMREHGFLLDRRLRNVEKTLAEGLVKIWRDKYLSTLMGSSEWEQVCFRVAKAELNPWEAVEKMWGFIKEKD